MRLKSPFSGNTDKVLKQTDDHICEEGLHKDFALSILLASDSQAVSVSDERVVCIQLRLRIIGSTSLRGVKS